MYKFNFKSRPFPITELVKEGPCEDCGEEYCTEDDHEMEKIDIIDNFDTSCNDDILIQHLINVDYKTGIVTISGYFSKEEAEKICSEDVFTGPTSLPAGHEIMSRIHLFVEEWNVDWEEEELYVNGEDEVAFWNGI